MEAEKLSSELVGFCPKPSTNGYVFHKRTESVRPLTDAASGYQRQDDELDTVKAFLRRYPLLSPQQQSLVDEHSAKAQMQGSSRKGKQPSKSKGGENDSEDGGMEREDEGEIVDVRGEEGTEGEMDMGSSDPQAGPSVQPVHRAPPKANALRRAVNRLVNLAEDFDEDESGLIYSSITLSMLEELSRVISLDPPADAQARDASKTAKRVRYDFILEHVSVGQ